MKKLGIVFAFCGSLICSSANAKTFVGVLWPMFGPLPAIGLVELVAELKMMPDVEVTTYLHQAWPALADDIARQPPGTHTVVVGYSLGANSSVFVANKSKYVDLIIALQPSMLSWAPSVTGKVGRMVEVYNPNPWLTFGGMGSRKLIGDNIEYIANNDSHPGAQFNFDFRNLVKTEIAKLTSDDRLETAQAQAPRPVKLAQLSPPAGPKPVEERPAHQQRDLAAKGSLQIADAQTPTSLKLERAAEKRPTLQQRDPAAKGNLQIADAEIPTSLKLEQAAQERPKRQANDSTAFLDQLSSSVNSGNLSVQRGLTVEDMKDYAERAYHPSRAHLITASAD